MSNAKKPAALTSGLLVKKGEASASTGAPQRGADPAPEITPPVKDQPMVPLNFKVPADWKEEFERYAFNSTPRRKMVDVLKDAFLALKEKEGLS